MKRMILLIKITKTNSHVSTWWSWCQTVIRLVIFIIIVQPWSIIIMEAASYSTVMNSCCLWLDCLLDLTLKSTYCAATWEVSTCPASCVCLCFTLCDCAHPAGARSLFELPPFCQLDSSSSKWLAGEAKQQSLLVLMVNKHSWSSLSYV